MECETDRLSFDVQLEKLPTPQVRKDSDAEKNKNNENCQSDQNNDNENNAATASAADNEKLSSGANIAFNSEMSNPPVTYLNSENERKSSNRSPNRSPTSNYLALRRSNGTFVQNDRLRRLSMRNSTKKMTAGRRTLLKEFECTIEGANFEPPICSTPISQPEQIKPIPPSNKENSESENITPNSEKKITNESCCGHTDTLIKTLERKDDELKNYLESILDRTLNKLENRSKAIDENSKEKTKDDAAKNKTYSKRTFTVEKGSLPGQIVLTPGKSSENFETQPSTTALKNTRRKLTTQHNQNKDKSLQTNQNSKNDKLHNSPQNTNLSIAFPSQNVEVPETQSQENNVNNTIIIQSGLDKNVVIIPFTQSVRKANNEKTNYNIHKNMQVESDSPAIEATSLKEAEDNLRLIDIFTDDEEETPKSKLISAEESSEKPLNLALSSCNLRKISLRKRITSKQKLQTDNSLQRSTHSSEQISKRKHLNKAPGMPLNGEEYAQDLARMSNCEILDLRKRNSMEQIFFTAGRKSRHSAKEASRKKRKLDHQIEKELLKRGFDQETEIRSCQEVPTEVENEILPAPSNFQDSLDIDCGLADEKSSDRVKFVGNNTKKKTSRRKNMPEILMQYLEVSKKYSKKSRHSRTLSRRSLFNKQDLNMSNEQINLEEEANALENCSSTSTTVQSLHYVKSPPKLDKNFLRTPKVVSPPPAVHSATETERSNTSPFINSTPPPPPPGFESDSRISSTNNLSPFTTNVTLQVGTAFTTNETPKTAHCEDDDKIFIKPVKPAPKRKVTKTKHSSSTSKVSRDDNQNSINSSADTISGGSLRRSKRGQVPKQTAPILEILYQQILKKKEKQIEYEKRKRKIEAKKQREIERNELKDAKSIKSQKSKSSKSNYSFPESNENSSDLLSRNFDALKRTRKLTKTKSRINKPSDNSSSRHLKAVRSSEKIARPKSKQKKSKDYQKGTEIDSSNDNVLCRQLTFSSPPPIRFLNNMFDRLKQNAETKAIQRSYRASTNFPQHKLKPLRIRVRRLKSAETIPENSSVSSTSSNTSNDLVSWLKNMSQTENSGLPSRIFKEMRISTASNLCFTELQGIEYAFYDTDQKASYGYLRFKPQQSKPLKKAKLYVLHYINLLGKFRIKVNNDESILEVGDMVIIPKTAYYSIQNITDEVGVLVVFKK